jgi:hypothetical protein
VNVAVDKDMTVTIPVTITTRLFLRDVLVSESTEELRFGSLRAETDPTLTDAPEAPDDDAPDVDSDPVPETDPEAETQSGEPA